jgi:hypothetical protein
MRIPLGVVLVAALTAYLLVSRPAGAGCLNPCEVSVEPAVVVPASECLDVRASAQTCDCGVAIVVDNRCSNAAVATDFVFDTCALRNQRPQDYGRDCDTVAPNGQGTVVYKLGPPEGPHDWSLSLQADGATVSISVHAVVSSFISEGCGCLLATARGAQRAPAAPLVGLGLLVSLGLRRHAKRRAVRDSA